ncbi:16S rRNA (adenine(1518)-N(6)/adenine(1519)-N(6))-dimethyltransferaseRsmA [soil metagenome]
MVQLLGPAEVRRLIDELGVRPTKQRGQNFVIDPNTVRRIARLAEVGPDEVVLEVGPGLGSLTLALLERTGGAGRVVTVEVDRALADALPDTIATRAPALAERCRVLHADALRLTAAPGPPPTAVVANLPYNVAVPVLLHLWALLPSLRHGLVLVQAEVADRLVAGPGSRTYGVPSVKAAWHGPVRSAGRVGRSVFWPVPNVDSALVSWQRGAPPDTTANRTQVFAVVDAAFAQRRKTLRAALSVLAGSPTQAESALRSAGVSPTSRGEDLHVDDFARIAEALATAG